ncbi:MAG: hypothetical protein EA409_00260 [Saprospirales bacterium]|nr:MAG: hypothetical protein EA409_00260 [Saprospirales bacterium]
MDEFGEEIGMSSFVYYNNPSGFTGPSAMTDPSTAIEHYRYLTGSWRDGTPFTYGGSGYRPSGGTPTRYALPDPPDDPNGWSMCTAGLEQADRRTLQASGPFRLIPGAVNELIVGVVWVPDIPHPCPDMTRLFNADRTAQALFDNCFDFPRGPDAPDLFVIELDQELIFTMANDTITSNNAFLRYEEKGLQIPEGEPDSMYVFEGYQVFQLRSESIEATRENFEDISRARLVFQTDIRNDITSIYNWFPVDDPFADDAIMVPKRMVAGTNRGLRHSFRIIEDVFSDDDRALINHKKYYFAVVAYGYNNFEQFNWREPEIGQDRPYLEGTRNVRVYTVVPRPTVYKQLNADYGDGVPITRLEGTGTGRNFLQLEEGIREAIADGTFDGELRYASGGGPIDVMIFNPLDVVDGEYQLTFFDEDPDSENLASNARWEVTNLGTGETVRSETGIDVLNETLIGRWGFSVTIGQETAPGTNVFIDVENGFLGARVVYDDPLGPQWLTFVPEDGPTGEGLPPSPLNYIKTFPEQSDFNRDPNRAFSDLNETGFYPYCLFDYRPPNAPLLTPAWFNNSNNQACSGANGIQNINNVDIVFTSDKSRWSRAMIVESSNSTYDASGLNFRGHRMFDIIDRPAASKDAGPDGLPLDDPSLPNGFGWFPGYAVDVETGRRLNVFFGESTMYSPDNPVSLVSNLPDDVLTGDDRMWNPHSDLIIPDLPGIAALAAGGQHFVYVTDQEYDGCEQLHTILSGVTPEPIRKPQVLRRIQWSAMPMATGLLSYEEGLIPNDAVVQLRVTKPYQVGERNEDGSKAYNSYFFKIEGKQAVDLVETEFDNALDQILAVPNPYYAYSAYEESQFDNTIKITNLPDVATVTIYTLDGKFIRRYERNVSRGGNEPFLNSEPPTKGRLPSSALEWDLRNHRGIPVSSGVYLFHVEAPGLGERVIKWFGISRDFDPSGL